MPYRSPARWLAPIALLVSLLAVILIASNSDTETSSGPDQRPVATETTTQRPRGAARRTYTVKSGDVLSAIAIKNGLTVQQLLDYNDDLDPQSLRPGQKLRLVPPKS